MKSKLKAAFIFLLISLLGFLVYKFILVRTVNYEIGGIKIPSQYNILTGTVKPITNYKGRTDLKTVEARKSNKIGLTEGQVVIANLRWAVFEEWASSHPEYKGWQKDAQIFKRANDAFRKELVSYKRGQTPFA